MVVVSPIHWSVLMKGPVLAGLSVLDEGRNFHSVSFILKQNERKEGEAFVFF